MTKKKGLVTIAKVIMLNLGLRILHKSHESITTKATDVDSLRLKRCDLNLKRSKKQIHFLYSIAWSEKDSVEIIEGIQL
jgi:hypothetical protein